MEKVWILLALGINAWKDIREREVNLCLTALLFIYGIGTMIWNKESMLEYLLPFGMSMMLIGLSILSSGAIGMGDALLLMALSVNLTMQEYFMMLCLAFVLAAGWALILMFVMKKGRQTEFPLVPFLLAGYLGGLAICV